MTKEAVHGSYLEEMKGLHGGKQVPPERVALVIGSNRAYHASQTEPGNIGLAIANHLQEQGFSVLDPTMGECNVTVPGHVTRVLDNFSGIDTLVLSNGHTYMDWIEYYPARQMEMVLHNSLLGSMIATSEFVSHTIDKPYHKHIVYIGSMAARGVLNASAPYCAAKAGLNSFCRCMGWELTPKGYTVTCVNPSNTKGTPMTERTIQQIIQYRGLTREQAEAYWASINLKREWLTPEDIAKVVSWLVSGQAAYMSGSAIDLNAGQR